MRGVKKSIVFRKMKMPADYLVNVCLLKHGDFLKENGLCGGTFEWNRDGGVIQLDAARAHSLLVKDLDHELQHMFVDWKEHYLKAFSKALKEFEERRVRRLAKMHQSRRKPR